MIEMKKNYYEMRKRESNKFRQFWRLIMEGTWHVAGE